jgi:pimeloyl-ACP methyl ester carboxylesterase
MALDNGNSDIQFAEITWKNRPVRLEYQWVGIAKSTYPVVVFLHEGLGSVAMWKDFPDRFCREHGFTGLVFSRYGYGQSTPRPADERWPVTFMQEQAYDVLPAFLSRLGIKRPWLFGHSDGATITLLHAARFPDAVSGITVVAPHIFTEDININSLHKAREAFLTTDLPAKLARYHADVDSAFWGWNNAWLDPAFREWSIEDQLNSISCPVLAAQGEDDEYGTLEQIYGIQRKVPGTQLLVLPNCGHSPHRDQPAQLSEEVASFIKRSC